MPYTAGLLTDEERETLSRIRRGSQAVLPAHVERLKELGLVKKSPAGVTTTQKGFDESRIPRGSR
jgi:ribosomal protein S19E (S16A)